MRRANGEIEAALAILTQAQIDYPGNWLVIRLHAEILRGTGATDAALALVSDFARKNWWHHDAAMALGRLHAQRGESHRAEEALWHASRLDVHDTDALNLLATTQSAQGRFEEAAAAQRRALRRQPDEPRQYLMLSEILTKMGRTAEAAAMIARMQSLQAVVTPQVVAN
jgi:Flp pilus assembly protein TadD